MHDPLVSTERMAAPDAATVMAFPPPTLRVAVVHDWLYTFGGAERVLQAIFRCFPTAELFCLFDLLDAPTRARIGYSTSHTSILQRIPGAARHHRLFLPLMPLAVEQLDLRGFDLVISSSYAVAKGVLTGPDQLHISYVHSPMRYAWDMQGQYLKDANLQTGLAGWMTRLLLHKMRMWDVRTASGVDHYIANSRFVARRIRKVYGRSASVIHPPVRVPAELPEARKEKFFFTASRLVRYKNVKAAVEAFALLPDQTLIVAGDGPELGRLRAIAGPNVQFLGFIDDDRLADLMARAAAFVFAAEEDFGIVPVEAQALGTPVIALGRGGARETIITEGPDRTGLFFDEAEPAQIAGAIRRFLERPADISRRACHANALRFAESRFQQAFMSFVQDAFGAFDRERKWRASWPLDDLEPALPRGPAS
jgi:glycosyltransferase involved in cell wall biosynthesis